MISRPHWKSAISSFSLATRLSFFLLPLKIEFRLNGSQSKKNEDNDDLDNGEIADKNKKKLIKLVAVNMNTEAANQLIQVLEKTISPGKNPEEAVKKAGKSISDLESSSHFSPRSKAASLLRRHGGNNNELDHCICICVSIFLTRQKITRHP